MNAQSVQLSPIRVAMLRHKGPYDQMESKFEQLWEWIEANGVPAQRSIGMYWDNPIYVPASDLRSAVCVEVPAGYQNTTKTRLPIEVKEIAGGEYITTTFTGPYERLGRVWDDLTIYVEKNLHRTISEAAAFEIYVNDPSETPPDQLITELYMPVL